MSKQEKIVCAAVVIYRGEDDCKGITVTGLTYGQCLDLVDELTHDYFDHCNEGFMTSHGRYVNKYEALTITGMQNQLRFKDRKYLLPEDLY